MKSYKLLFIFVLLLFIGWKTGSPNTDCSFNDKYGNTFTIKNSIYLPHQIDTVFLKSNLNGSYFDKTLNDKSQRFHYTVSEIKTTKKKKEFEILMRATPLDASLETTLQYVGGFSHYCLILKTVNDKLEIDKILFVSAEI